jgi:hypothetical protein
MSSTAPLWGLGGAHLPHARQPHRDVREAIAAHRSEGDGVFPASEANAVIDAFNALTEEQKQSAS